MSRKKTPTKKAAKRLTKSASAKKKQPRQPAATPPVQLTGLNEAPEIYVDGFSGTAHSNGVVKINFFSKTFDPVESKQYNKTAFVLVCSLPTLLSIHKTIGDVFESLRKSGVIEVLDVEASDV